MGRPSAGWPERDAPTDWRWTSEGAIWVAESQDPALLRLTMDGEVEVVLTACGDEPFLWPNDVAFGPDGALYMTDSGIRFADFMQGTEVRPDYLEVPMYGRVYKIDTATRAVETLDSGLRFPNGIAFGPDQDLYVSETMTGMVYRYRWQDGAVGAEAGFREHGRPAESGAVQGA